MHNNETEFTTIQNFNKIRFVAALVLYSSQYNKLLLRSMLNYRAGFTAVKLFNKIKVYAKT